MRGVMAEPQHAGSQLGGESLLGRVAGGDEEAVARFYDRYADAVFRFIQRRVAGCREDAEEITQDTFLAAVACAATFDGTCAPLTWLCGLARVRLADFFRRQGRQKRSPPGRVLSLDVGGVERRARKLPDRARQPPRRGAPGLDRGAPRSLGLL